MNAVLLDAETAKGRYHGPHERLGAADVIVCVLNGCARAEPCLADEEGFDLVDCGSCVIAPACGFTGILNEALRAFMAVLDGYTLANLVVSKADMAKLVFRQPASPAADGA